MFLQPFVPPFNMSSTKSYVLQLLVIFATNFMVLCSMQPIAIMLLLFALFLQLFYNHLQCFLKTFHNKHTYHLAEVFFDNDKLTVANTVVYMLHQNCRITSSSFNCNRKINNKLVSGSYIEQEMH